MGYSRRHGYLTIPRFKFNLNCTTNHLTKYVKHVDCGAKITETPEEMRFQYLCVKVLASVADSPSLQPFGGCRYQLLLTCSFHIDDTANASVGPSVTEKSIAMQQCDNTTGRRVHRALNISHKTRRRTAADIKVRHAEREQGREGRGNVRIGHLTSAHLN